MAINPLNGNARVGYSISGLSQDEDQAETGRREAIAAGLEFAPIDARIVSLAGIVLERAGDNGAAEKLYDASLRISPTEPQALFRKFRFLLVRQERAEAARLALIVMRRWRQHWPAFEPLLPELFSDDSALSVFTDHIVADPEMRERLISSLSRDAGNLPLAYAIVEKWAHEGVVELSPQINHVVSRLVAEKQHASAYRLFRTTLDPERGGDSDYLVNGDFRYPSTGSIFDWNVRAQTGVDVILGTRPGKQQGLELRFLDSPVLLATPRQSLRLAPFHYRLSVTYSTQQLQYPRPVRLELICGKAVLASLLFEGSDVTARTIEQGFYLPENQCPLSEIRFATDKLPESWRNRYSGILTVERVSIIPAE